MHVHNNPERVRLIHRSGVVYEYASIANLAVEVGGVPAYFGEFFDQDRVVWQPCNQNGDWCRWAGTPPAGWKRAVVPAEVFWVARTESGAVVSADDIREARPRRESWMRRREREQREAMERGLPIPRTGKRRWSSFFRYPKTMQEIRRIAALETDQEDCPIPIEQTGRLRHPPTHRDELLRQDREHRSWKRHRRTRWRGQA